MNPGMKRTLRKRHVRLVKQSHTPQGGRSNKRIPSSEKYERRATATHHRLFHRRTRRADRMTVNG